MARDDFFDKSVDVIAAVGLAAAVLVVCAILGYQSFIWLQHAVWIPIPTSFALEWAGVDLGWVSSPTSWVGAAKVIGWILELPLSLVAPFVLFLGTQSLRSAVRDA